MKVGDRVKKHPDGWIPSDFDAWGAGEGVGEIVDVVEAGCWDVQWPTGRAFQMESELIVVEES